MRYRVRERDTLTLTLPQGALQAAGLSFPYALHATAEQKKSSWPRQQIDITANR